MLTEYSINVWFLIRKIIHASPNYSVCIFTLHTPSSTYIIHVYLAYINFIKKYFSKKYQYCTYFYIFTMISFYIRKKVEWISTNVRHFNKGNFCIILFNAACFLDIYRVCLLSNEINKYFILILNSELMRLKRKFMYKIFS